MAAGSCRRAVLKNLDPLLGPDLLHILRSMGHGDEVAIVDANYPAHAAIEATRIDLRDRSAIVNANYPAQRGAQRLVRLDGVCATRALQAILSVLPLDAYVRHPVLTMQVVGDADAVPEIVAEFRRLVAAVDGSAACGALERFSFYNRVKGAFAVVATGERRLYGNILLTKGVIDPD